MNPAIVLATCLRWPDLSASDRLYAEVLAARGVTVRDAPWNGPFEAFAGADLVVLRGSWDYHHAPGAFRDWLTQLEGAGTPVLNPPALVCWNMDKSYLLDLARWGVAIPATRVVAPDAAAVRGAMAELRTKRAVLKPSFGASGHLVRLAGADEVDDAVFAFLADPQARNVVVQEFLPELQSEGEVSCVFFSGAFSHAALKRPAEGEFRINSQYGGINTALDIPDDILAQAAGALAVLPELPLYARVDGVVRDGRFLLLELELIEPGLFLQQDPLAAGRFADATAHRLQQ